jgi:hypothetical protein
MAEPLKLLVGSDASLAPYARVRAGLVAYRLSAGSPFAVVPFDADLQDHLHAHYGTGEWLDAPDAPLTTSDLAFAARASLAGPLAYLERWPPVVGATADGTADAPVEIALLWQAGVLALRPRALIAADRVRLAPPFWPINTVLRSLGVGVVPGLDEAAAFGLERWSTAADIVAAAPRVRIG